MKEKLFRSLIELGLKDEEAKMYLTLLQSQKMTISEISRATQIKRATCYEHIDDLLAKDFVIRVPVGKRMFYSAVNPKKVLSGAKKRFAAIEQSISEMSAQYDVASNRPKVEFYEGKREIKNIYEDLFETVGEVRSFFPPEAFLENFSLQEYDEFDAALTKHALVSKDLFIQGKYLKQIEEIRTKNGSESKKSKRLPKDFKSNVDVLIYSDKVALVSLKDLSATVLENKDIADFFRSVHALIWRTA